MKAHLIVAACLLNAVTHAEKEADAPADLAALKQHYKEEVAAATKPTRDRYITALQNLQRSLIQKNDLSGVLVVQQELASVSGTVATGAAEPPVAKKGAKPPPEFTALQQRFKKDIQSWSKPPRDRYIVALQALLRTTMQKGDLSGASTIQAELTAVQGPILNEKDQTRKDLLTSSWWQIRDLLFEFAPDGQLIQRGNPDGWQGMSWKFSDDGKFVECTFTNGQKQSYSFKNGKLIHFDPAWGEFKKVTKK